jgi:ABC transporter substrate binding protein
MKRREFIILTSVAAAGWPLPSLAQRPVTQQRIAVVHAAITIADMSESGNDPLFPPFFKELRQLGYIEGQNLVVDRYSGEGRGERYAEVARNVILSKPDLIFTTGADLSLALKAATNTIPIVVVMANPVTLGVVESLARQGGNITGISSDAGLETLGKRLEILKEVLPTLSSIGFLASRSVWEGPSGKVRAGVGSETRHFFAWSTSRRGP